MKIYKLNNNKTSESYKCTKKYKLQDLFDINRGKIINSKYLNDNKGEYPVISSNTKNNGIFGYINTYMYNGEYITVSADGAYAGTIFYQNGKFSITNVCFILKPKVKKLFYLKFAFIYLKNIEQKIQKECSVGSSRPAVREYSLKNVKINLPSLEIQRSIIDIIEPLEKINKVIFSNKLKIEKIITMIYNLFPKKYINLNEISNILNNKYLNQEFYCETKNIGELSINKLNLKKINKFNKPSRADLTVAKNSIIVSKIIGENKILAIDDYENVVFSTGFLNIQSKNQKNDHLIAFLLSKDFIFQKKSLETGTLMASINLNNFKKIKIKKDYFNSNVIFETLSKLVKLEFLYSQLMSKILIYLNYF